MEAFVAKNLPAASSKLTGTNVVVAAAAVDSYTAVGFVVAAGFGKRYDVLEFPRQPIELWLQITSFYTVAWGVPAVPSVIFKAQNAALMEAGNLIRFCCRNGVCGRLLSGVRCFSLEYPPRYYYRYD